MRPKLRRRKTDLSDRLSGYSATAAAALLGSAISSADAAGGNISFTENFTADSTFINFIRNEHATLRFTAGPLMGTLDLYSRFVQTTGDIWTNTHITQNANFVGANTNMKFASDNSNDAVAFSLGQPLTGQVFQGAPNLAGRQILSTNSVFENVQTAGPLGPGGTRYFGFRVIRNATTYYGWLRLSLGVNGNHEFENLAFAPTGDGLIGAFMSKNDPNFSTFGAGLSAVPEPSTVALTGLGLLALGAYGTRTLRQRRAQRAS